MNTLVLLLAAPVLEEAVFRAGLHEALLQHGAAAWAANMLTAAVFALAHMVLRQDAAAWVVMLPALAIGAVYIRWRRLRWCMALHAAMNAVWLLA